jgi:hypothetical protein
MNLGAPASRCCLAQRGKPKKPRDATESKGALGCRHIRGAGSDSRARKTANSARFQLAAFCKNLIGESPVVTCNPASARRKAW